MTSIQRSGGSWIVGTSKGEIRTKIVVNAAGQWARQVGRMVGVDLPVAPLEHHYLITEEMEEVRALETELRSERHHVASRHGPRREPGAGPVAEEQRHHDADRDLARQPLGKLGIERAEASRGRLERGVEQQQPGRERDRRLPRRQRIEIEAEGLLEILESLSLDYDPIWGSMIKQTLRRVYPGFNEGYMGYRNFAELLKHAESEGYISLEYDESRGNFKVRLLDY